MASSESDPSPTPVRVRSLPATRAMRKYRIIFERGTVEISPDAGRELLMAGQAQLLSDYIAALPKLDWSHLPGPGITCPGTAVCREN